MTQEADVVVIGSGIAGAMVAWRLARAGLRVLVLEAGPRVDRSAVVREFTRHRFADFSAGFPHSASAPRPDWESGTDAYIHQAGPDPVRFEYLRVVGGTTWHWSGGSDRFAPADFELRARHQVGTDWPFGYAALAPYYAEAEREIGVAGDAQTAEGVSFPLPAVPLSYADKAMAAKLREIGIAITPRGAARNTQAYDGRPRCEGFGTCAPICPIGAQYAAIVHVEKAEASGARVLADCRVDRLEAETGTGTGRIVAAQFARPDGSTDRAEAKMFVLAANAMESPRLLLVSAGEGFPQGLANRSDQVGRNFMAHPGLQYLFDMPDPIYGGRGPAATFSINDFRDTPARRDEAAIAISGDNAGFHLISVAAELLNANMLPPELDAAFRERSIRRGGFVAFVEQLPDPDNRVTIDWSARDSAGQPRVALHHRIGSYEQRGLTRAKEFFDRIGKHMGVTHVSHQPVGSNHLIGTLAMGSDPLRSVVDLSGRAHDHNNLFVAGSAVFPTGSCVGPTLTLAALSLRSADAIAAQLR